jgi:hypothetical protein
MRRKGSQQHHPEYYRWLLDLSASPNGRHADLHSLERRLEDLDRNLDRVRQLSDHLAQKEASVVVTGPAGVAPRFWRAGAPSPSPGAMLMSVAFNSPVR